MRLELTGRHIDITPGMRRLVDGKLSRLERLLNDSGVSAQVVFSREKTGSRADITLHARGEKFMHGAGKGPTWQVAISQATDKVSQQAKKIKGKYQEWKRRASKSGAAAPASTDGGALSRTPTRAPVILDTSRQTVRALTIGEASRKLGAKGRVVVFRNAETGEVSVLFRAASGDMVLVETDV